MKRNERRYIASVMSTLPESSASAASGQPSGDEPSRQGSFDLLDPEREVEVAGDLLLREMEDIAFRAEGPTARAEGEAVAVLRDRPRERWWIADVHRDPESHADGWPTGDGPRPRSR
jgi:hypothetical protein